LKEAIEQLREAPDIEEPAAKENREALHLDDDLNGGVAGGPDLARTIFDKIQLSGVVSLKMPLWVTQAERDSASNETGSKRS
jgi:hypothetical protein